MKIIALLLVITGTALIVPRPPKLALIVPRPPKIALIVPRPPAVQVVVYKA